MKKSPGSPGSFVFPTPPVLFHQSPSSAVSEFGRFGVRESRSLGVWKSRNLEVSVFGRFGADSSLSESREFSPTPLAVPLRRIVHRSALAALERLRLLRLSRRAQYDRRVRRHVGREWALDARGIDSHAFDQLLLRRTASQRHVGASHVARARR